MQIKVIAVGSTKWERFIRQWGISLLIGDEVLFDTFGDADVLLRNMRKFDIDPLKIKHIVVSHDDWDHVSGLWYLLPHRQDSIVYICPGFARKIKDRIHSFGVTVVEAGESTRIKDNIYSTGECPRVGAAPSMGEQSVVITTTQGLVLICGCAHPGIVNIVRYGKECFNANVYSIVGGFHLKDNSEEENQKIIKALRQLGVRKVVPMHCTGRNATAALRRAYGNDFRDAETGAVIEV